MEQRFPVNVEKRKKTNLENRERKKSKYKEHIGNKKKTTETLFTIAVAVVMPARQYKSPTALYSHL